MTDKRKTPNDPTAKVGIQWPLESGGRTTNVAKDVWCAAALAAKDNGLSEAIKRERNLRATRTPIVQREAKDPDVKASPGLKAMA